MEIEINKSCCFTGHRPEKCIGSEEVIRAMLLKEIQNAIHDGFDTFITGMANGVDTWAAEEVLKIKEDNNEIKLVCAVPFKEVEKKRTVEEQKLFQRILNKSEETTYICPKQTRWCFYARDKWMVNHSTRVIAVFNGTHGGTEYTINYANKKEREVILLNDAEGLS